MGFEQAMSNLFDFAVLTIFARECLEGAIIVGQYRTIILRGRDALAPDVTVNRALKEVNMAVVGAAVLALLVIAAVAAPLAILSNQFDTTTAYILEGVSKIVAAISLLQLSLKIPKMLQIYKSSKANDSETPTGLTLRHIRFNVAWNIWREVAECGVFLIPFFLNGENLEAIPISAVAGSIVGLLIGLGIYVANKRLSDKRNLCIFAVLLLVVLSSGLFTGGCHKLEIEIGATKQVWKIDNEFWDVHRLPMTILKPFGYNDSRTVLEIVCYWGWLLLSAALHYRKYKRSPKVNRGRLARPSFVETEEDSLDRQAPTIGTGDMETELTNSMSPDEQMTDCNIGGGVGAEAVDVESGKSSA